jgi:hypothetical protein
LSSIGSINRFNSRPNPERAYVEIILMKALKKLLFLY